MMSIVVSDGEARGRENDHVSLELRSRRQEVASIDGDFESLRPSSRRRSEDEASEEGNALAQGQLSLASQ